MELLRLINILEGQVMAYNANPTSDELFSSVICAKETIMAVYPNDVVIVLDFEGDYSNGKITCITINGYRKEL